MKLTAMENNFIYTSLQKGCRRVEHLMFSTRPNVPCGVQVCELECAVNINQSYNSCTMIKWSSEAEDLKIFCYMLSDIALNNTNEIILLCCYFNLPNIF